MCPFLFDLALARSCSLAGLVESTLVAVCACMCVQVSESMRNHEREIGVLYVCACKRHSGQRRTVRLSTRGRIQRGLVRCVAETYGIQGDWEVEVPSKRAISCLGNTATHQHVFEEERCAGPCVVPRWMPRPTQTTCREQQRALHGCLERRIR